MYKKSGSSKFNSKKVAGNFWERPLKSFARIEELDDTLPESFFIREQIPWEAAFLAGKCFLKYRRSGGVRSSPLPDFFIGAHASVRNMSLLTRDKQRYGEYFPKLKIISP
jgi:predicted nucleic acid-binding protein